MNRSRITGDLVSQNNIFVDIANDRVGIGTTQPTHKIDLDGSFKLHDGSGYDNHITFTQNPPTITFPSGSTANLGKTPTLVFGDRASGGDFKIYQDFYSLHMRHFGPSGLHIGSVASHIQISGSNGSNNTQASIRIDAGATEGVKLYSGGTQRFETVGYGVTVLGTTETQELNVTGVSTFTGEMTVNSTLNTVKVEVNSTNAQIDLTSGQASFTRYGAINHYHNNSTSTVHNQIKLAPRNGSTGRIMFYNLTGGSLTERLRIDGTDGIQAIAHITPMSDNLYALGGTATRWSSVTSRVLHLIETDDGSSAGPELKLYRNSASPADADYLGQIKFAGESDTGVERNYAKITGKILDASNGTEDGIIEFAHIKAGSQTITGRWRSDSLQLLNGTSLTVAGTAEVTGAATFSEALTLSKDTTDVINLSANSTSDKRGISFNSRTALSADYNDGFLRLNNENEFTNGVYTPGLMRADGGFKTDGNVVVNSSGFIVASRIAGALPAIDGSNLTGIDTDLVSDTSPQLGGDLDTNSHHILLDDDHEVKFGASSDLRIFHANGNANFIQSYNNHDLRIHTFGTSAKVRLQVNESENSVVCTPNGPTELYYDNEMMFRTNQDGSEFFDSDNNCNVYFTCNGTRRGYIFVDSTNGGKMSFYDNQNHPMLSATKNGAVDLYHDNSLRFSTKSAGFESFGGQYTFYGVEGGATQLLLYADEGDDLNDRWRVMSGGSNDFIIGNLADGSWDTSIKAYGDGAVELYHNDSKKFETSSAGGTLTGVLSVSSNIRVSGEIDLGTANGNKFMDVCLGDNYGFYLRSTSGEGQNHEALARFERNRGAILYWDANTRFETTTAGIDVTGTITMDAVPGANTNADLPVLFQTSAGVIDGGSQLTYNPGGDVLKVNGLTLSSTQIRTSGSSALQLTTANANGTVDLLVRTTHVECNGHFLPQTNNTDDLGGSGKAWRNLYVNDAHFSNKGHSNDVDGTWGDWTLQEGENDIFMINNRTGKKFAITMREVS